MQTIRRLPAVLVFLAVTVPTLVALDVLPIIGQLQQLLALLAWGMVVLVLGLVSDPSNSSPYQWPRWLLGLLLAITAIGVFQSFRMSGTQDNGLLTAGLLLSAAAVFWAVSSRCPDVALTLGAALLFGMLLAGLLHAVIAVVQVVRPTWADDVWIAAGSLPGRGNGNARQPNHLATLILWAMVALGALVELRRIETRMALGAFVLLTVGLLLSASRMGMVGLALLGLWAAIDRSMLHSRRRLLLVAPVVVLIVWGFVTLLVHLSADGLMLNERLTAWSGPSTRGRLWVESFRLIQESPLTGVGWGEFNFAWTLSPKSVGQFNHFSNAHNLPLHLAVELGVPLAAAVMGVLVYVFWGAWRAFKAALDVKSELTAVKRAACMMLMLIALHSGLEYPLWYAVFLLPTAMLLGLCAVSSSSAALPPKTIARSSLLAPAGLVMVLAAFFAAYDYAKVAPLNTPETRANPMLLDARLNLARGSLLHSWIAFGATARSMRGNPMGLDAMHWAAHGWIDTRLLIAWADTLNAAGQSDKARYIAQRVAEFSDPAADIYLKPCKSALHETHPFQCLPPLAPLSFRDFR